MSTHGFLHQAIIYLGAALVMVPLAHRLGLGSVLGYLAAGVVIGPSALGLIEDPEQVLHFSEFGVVLLLFLIGLELNPRRLWTMRKPIFEMGGLQVALCVAGLALVGLAFGFDNRASLVLGMGFAMSSTALALQLLREKNLHQIPVGESSFAVLLFQDLAVIPMMAAIPLLAPVAAGAESAGGIARLIPFAKVLLALAGVILAGRYVIRPIFRVMARTHIREIFTAFALAIVFGVALLMDAVGLSMALGTFLAGILLAESEFRHELEVDIEPFKGLLLGLFFIAVGMSMQLGILKSDPLLVLGLVLALLSVKLAVLFGIARLFRHSRQESALFALALSQGGEFAFVLFGVATEAKVLEPSQTGLLNIAIALSMAATPFLFMLHERIANRWLDSTPVELGPEHHARPEGNPVILAGYGRVGQVIGRLLHSQSIGITILELDPGQIETVRKFGWRTFYGDVSRLDMLRSAGAEAAKLLVLAIDDMEAVARTISLAKEHFPHLKVLVRADSRIDAYHFINTGVEVVRSTFAPGLEMGEEALKLLGVPSHETRSIAQRFKRYDREQLFKAAKHVADIDALITLSAQSKEELSRIMATDEKKRAEIVGDGWG